jgi:ABC-type transport system involved in multi-copper enzyme maturation permease subunit
MNPLGLLFGPLVVPECRRAGARGWLILVRTLAAFTAGSVVISLIWFWWFFLGIDPEWSPYTTLRVGVATLEGMALLLALVFSPAVLAGSLAGDRERGSLGLLLTTRVSSREIVSGRLAGKLSQVAMIALGFVPPLVLIAGLAGIRMRPFLMLFALPAAVAFGAGGIAIAASCLSRRGRDALLVVYLLDIFLLSAPLVGTILPAGTLQEIAFLSPFHAIVPLVWRDEMRAAVGTTAIWLIFGIIGIAIAAWRLRPVCMGQYGGTRRRKLGRRWFVPPVGEQPMLWKELYIEHVGTLGRFGRWLGLLIVLYLVVGSTALALCDAWFLFVRPNSGWSDYLTAMMSTWYGERAFVVAFLIEWAIGLRAAVAISSERERGTWDALLMSPLQGGEIVVGKLWGSLFALRVLFVSAVWAWTLALLFGAMSASDYLTPMAQIFVAGAFMAAVGVRASLATATATRAMTITIGVWMGALMAVSAGALMIVGMVMMFCLAAFSLGLQLGMAWTAPWFPTSFETGFTLARLGLYLLATFAIVAEARLRFDRIAGRMAGTGVQISVDRLLHGLPMEPVAIGPVEEKVEPPSEVDGAAPPHAERHEHERAAAD